MLIVRKGVNETVDRLIRRYRKKHKDTQMMREIRKRREFVKPSTKRREEVAKARYKLKKQSEGA